MQFLVEFAGVHPSVWIGTALLCVLYVAVGRVMAIIGVPRLLGPILGPILGGWLVEWNWRTIFLINLPLAALIGTATEQLSLRSGPGIGGLLNATFGNGAALLIGLGLITVLPGFFRTTLREARRIGLSMGIGALALIVSVVLLVLGVLLILVGVGAGFAAVLLYAPILYLAQVFVGAWLGIRIRGEGANETGAIVGRMALGLLVLHLVGLIPVLGALMWLVVGLWGTGAILLAFYRMSRTEPAPLPA